MRDDPGRLIVGTAQLGGHYGIANRHGVPSRTELVAILRLAASLGVGTLDTAAAYGEAEAVLGDAGIAAFDVISKLAPDVASGGVGGAIDRTLRRLRCQALSGLLLHRAPPEHSTLELLREAGQDDRVTRVGVSVYEPSQVTWLLEHGAPLDIVQAPFSVFDQRFRAVGEEMARRGIEFHARSVFLQGLYFLDERDLPGALQAIRGPLGIIRQLADQTGIPLPTLLLRYAATQPFISKVVVGVEVPSQLESNVAAMEADLHIDRFVPELDNMALADEAVLLPSRWPARSTPNGGGSARS
jgi:aryl-alcohol dehydrogenase-like predicted oxidoreductase